MTETRLLKQTLNEGLDFKAFNTKKLAEVTGIPERYIEALRQGQYNVLPALPYVKGYLGKVAKALDLNQEEIWQLYLKETTPKSSGSADFLPGNRFRVQTISKKLIVLPLVIILLTVYLFFNLGKIIRGPELTLTHPLSETILTEKSKITLEGRTDPQNKLTINGEEAYVDKNGRFVKDYNLQPGLNVIEFTAKKFLGRETKINRQIIHQPSAAASLGPSEVLAPGQIPPAPDEQGPQNQIAQ